MCSSWCAFIEPYSPPCTLRKCIVPFFVWKTPCSVLLLSDICFIESDFLDIALCSLYDKLLFYYIWNIPSTLSRKVALQTGFPLASMAVTSKSPWSPTVKSSISNWKTPSWGWSSWALICGVGAEEGFFEVPLEGSKWRQETLAIFGASDGGRTMHVKQTRSSPTVSDVVPSTGMTSKLPESWKLSDEWSFKVLSGERCISVGCPSAKDCVLRRKKLQ